MQSSKHKIEFLCNANCEENRPLFHSPSSVQEIPDSAPIPGSSIYPLQHTKISTHTTTHYHRESELNKWLFSLRAQTYCNFLRDASLGDDKKFNCPFSTSCEKKVKGKGNLRRHIEWHLKRIEDHYTPKNAFQSLLKTPIPREIIKENGSSSPPVLS